MCITHEAASIGSSFSGRSDFAGRAAAEPRPLAAPLVRRLAGPKTLPSGFPSASAGKRVANKFPFHRTSWRVRYRRLLSAAA
jgi:hypothetical protein